MGFWGSVIPSGGEGYISLKILKHKEEREIGKREVNGKLNVNVHLNLKCLI